MNSLLQLSRRGLVRFGLVSAAIAPFSRAFTPFARVQDAGPDSGTVGAVRGRAETELYPGKGLPGGGQLEIRLTATLFTSDPDQLEVAQRMKPFNLDSWVTEWTRVAERNEEMAERLAAEGHKVNRSPHDGFLQENARDVR